VTLTSALGALNHLEATQRAQELFKCCSSHAWVKNINQRFPFESEEALFVKARLLWFELGEKDMMEAFSHHPRIGDRVKSASWASQEQASTLSAAAGDLALLKTLNEEYEKKFPHVFLICATGKSVEEMLSELKRRIALSLEEEFLNASIEQSKITQLRLQKLLEGFRQS